MSTIAFDVDGTLINVADTPRYEVILLFKLFEYFGWTMVIWSGDGIDYARRWSEKLGLKALILEKCSIDVDAIVDDMIDQENWGKTHKVGIVIKV